MEAVRRGRPPSQTIPETALQLLIPLSELADALQGFGWTVNLAIEAGNGRESVSFSAFREPHPQDPK